MTLDGALAMIPALAEQQRRIEAKVDRLLAALATGRGRWVTIREYAETRGCSRDTVERQIERGEVKVERIAPDRVTSDGRTRRSLRLWLAPPVDDAEIRQIAHEMTGPIAEPGEAR